MSRKRKSILRFAAAMLSAFLWSVSSAMGQDVRSDIVVIDGDTLEIDGVVSRLYGIDAPELGQTCLDGSKRWRCGLQAALELRNIVTSRRNVKCGTIRMADEAPRAICHDPQYNDPAELLLTRGLAVALPDSVPAYRRAEYQAKSAKLGIWRGEFVEPSKWRTGERLAGPTDGPAEICDVKGIISKKGERLYYVPTDKNYDAIEVRPDQGERMFCSDDEAELAGWRRYPRS